MRSFIVFWSLLVSSGAYGQPDLNCELHLNGDLSEISLIHQNQKQGDVYENSIETTFATVKAILKKASGADHGGSFQTLFLSVIPKDRKFGGQEFVAESTLAPIPQSKPFYAQAILNSSVPGTTIRVVGGIKCKIL